jgi:hypothetical protein
MDSPDIALDPCVLWDEPVLIFVSLAFSSGTLYISPYNSRLELEHEVDPQ